MDRRTLSPELRAELPVLYRQWLAAKRMKKASKVRRARARWLDALAAVVDRQRERRAPLVALLAALADKLRSVGIDPPRPRLAPARKARPSGVEPGAGTRTG